MLISYTMQDYPASRGLVQHLCIIRWFIFRLYRSSLMYLFNYNFRQHLALNVLLFFARNIVLFYLSCSF